MPTQSLLTPESVQLVGGLDFVTPRPSVAPGSLIDCYNFEVADRLGYKTIDGIERFDGSISSSKTFTSLYSVTYNSSTPMVVGEFIWVAGISPIVPFGTITSVETVPTGGMCANFVVTDFSALSSALISRLQGSISVASQGVSAAVIGMDEYTTAHSVGGIADSATPISTVQDSINRVCSENKNIETTKTASVTVDNIPSGLRPNPVIGMHWFNERLYAVNDLDGLYFDTGSLQIFPNDILTVTFTGSTTHLLRVRDIVVTSGTWTGGNAAGKILYTFEPNEKQPKNFIQLAAPTGGTFIQVTRGAAPQTNAAKIASTNPTLKTTWYAGLSYAQNNSDLEALAGVSSIPANQGFTNVELGYNFSYTNGTSSGPPSIVVRDATPVFTSKTYTPVSTASVVAIPSGGTIASSYSTGVGLVYAGTSPSVAIATANDSSYIYPTATNISPPTTTVAPTILSGFNVGTIASGSLIIDAEVHLNCFANANAAGKTYKISVDLSVDGVNYSAAKTTDRITSTSATATQAFTLGGPLDPWSIPGATVDNIANLQARVIVNLYGAGATNALVYLDYFDISVSYQKNVGTYFFNNGTDDVTAVITNVYLDPSTGGNWSTNNAAGVMQVISVAPAPLAAPASVAVTTSTTGGTALSANTTYYYVVTAKGTIGETTASSMVSVTTGAGTTNSNTATWAASTGAASYDIYRSTTGGAPWSHQALGNVTSFTDTGTGWGTQNPPATNTSTNTIRQRITSGDKIYTSSNASGSLLGTVSSDMQYSGLASYSQLQANNSQYEIIDANFYGNVAWNAMYLVNGAGRPSTYDGHYFRTIFTGLAATVDIPRHVTFYNFHLVLGYPTGSCLTSVAGSPEDFSGLDGAGEFDTGDFITGLLRLNGTSLGIFCKNSIHVLNGTDNTNFSMSVFNPYEGAIEYTIVDCGKPIWASNKGISTLTQSAAYGNFAGTRLSANITPWLLPRLVSDPVYTPGGIVNTGTYTTTPNARSTLFAIPVRNKNQYKLAFSDGYWLTMTLQGPELTPTFTIQFIETQKKTISVLDTRTLVPLAYTTATDAFGKDRNFVSWYDYNTLNFGLGLNTDSLYVWELDRGWGFGSQTPIPAWFTTTHNFFDNPFQIMTVRDVRLHGLSLGLGTLTVAASADYLSNDFTNGNIYGQLPTNAQPQDISLPRDGGLNPFKFRSGDLQPQTNIASVGKTGRSFSFQFATPPSNAANFGAVRPPVVAQQLLFQLSSGKADIK